MEYRDIIEPEFIEAANICHPICMQSIERLYALYRSVTYVLQAGIEGDFVECGVWKGASPVLIAKTLLAHGITDRTIWLYDTFDGMTPATDIDIDRDGRKAVDLLASSDKSARIWAYSPIEEVWTNLCKTGYPMELFRFVKGDVMSTLPSVVPDNICLLRLDTDWYESTRHELENLFPRVTDRGVLIIDDYGCFRGSRKATDEYLATLPDKYLLHRLDASGRMLIKH